MEEDYLLTEELVVVQILDGVSDKKIKLDDVFFSDSYKCWLQINQRQNNSRKLQLVEDTIEDDYLEDDSEYEDQDIYEEANEEMIMDLELYATMYQMPMFSLTNEEWNLFFQTLCSYYLEKDLSEVYVPEMVTLNRFAIAKSLINHQTGITLTTYISALRYMESDALNISDILEMIGKLETAFGMKNLKELIQNMDGSYGNYGKQFPSILEEIKGMEKYFGQDTKNEEPNATQEPLEELGDNIVNFQKYLAKRNK